MNNFQNPAMLKILALQILRKNPEILKDTPEYIKNLIRSLHKKNILQWSRLKAKKHLNRYLSPTEKQELKFYEILYPEILNDENDDIHYTRTLFNANETYNIENKSYSTGNKSYWKKLKNCNCKLLRAKYTNDMNVEYFSPNINTLPGENKKIFWNGKEISIIDALTLDRNLKNNDKCNCKFSFVRKKSRRKKSRRKKSRRKKSRRKKSRRKKSRRKKSRRKKSRRKKSGKVLTRKRKSSRKCKNGVLKSIN